MSSLPIHQDGSCNGLQHYAALGRDEAGAIAVNVKPSVRPQDVYTGVLDIVLVKIEADMAIPEDDADENRSVGIHILISTSSITFYSRISTAICTPIIFVPIIPIYCDVLMTILHLDPLHDNQ